MNEMCSYLIGVFLTEASIDGLTKAQVRSTGVTANRTEATDGAIEAECVDLN